MNIFKEWELWIGLFSVGMIAYGTDIGNMASAGCGALYANVYTLLRKRL